MVEGPFFSLWISICLNFSCLLFPGLAGDGTKKSAEGHAWVGGHGFSSGRGTISWISVLSPASPLILHNRYLTSTLTLTRSNDQLLQGLTLTKPASHSLFLSPHKDIPLRLNHKPEPGEAAGLLPADAPPENTST